MIVSKQIVRARRMENLGQKVFIPQVLARIRLVEGNNGHWIGSTYVQCRLGSHTKTQWQIIHRVDYDSLILARLVCDATQSRFENMIAVQELLFGILFEPNFVLSIRTR